MFKKRLMLFIGLFALFIISISISYISYGYFFEEKSKPTPVALNSNQNLEGFVINQDTSIFKVQKYKCGNEIKEKIKNIQWIGKSFNELKDIYTTNDGWNTELSNNKITLSKYYDNNCPYHSMKHFGIYKGKLAIFEGPLGDNVKVLEVESNVSLSNLPTDYLHKLNESMKITDIHAVIKQELRDELEFANDSELEEALQNLDEYMEY